MRFVSAVVLAAVLLTCTAMAAIGQTLTSDQPDYRPGATATLTGAGFAPGENVVLVVHHADASPDSGADHEPWTVVADENGAFVTTWHVCEDDCVGATLLATADGTVSGLHAELVFTDGAGVTAATGGANRSADLAQNGAAPAFTTLGNMIITEGNNKARLGDGVGGDGQLGSLVLETKNK